MLMCKEMPVILVDRVADEKRIIGKRRARRRRGARGRRPKKAFDGREFESLPGRMLLAIYAHRSVDIWYIHTYIAIMTFS
jgi:hypothetical protein